MPPRRPAAPRSGTALVLAACLSAATLHSAVGAGSGDGAPPVLTAPSLLRIRGGLKVSPLPVRIPHAFVELSSLKPGPRQAPAARTLLPSPSRDVADLRGHPRTIAIFTTAALPWLTGTSINALLRAWALARTCERHHVTLCVPFLDPEDQEKALNPPRK